MINKILKELSIKCKWGYTDNPVPLSFLRFEKWQEEGHFGPLTYMSDERAKLRADIRDAYPSFQSALVFIFPFLETKAKLETIYCDPSWNGLKIAAYSFAYDVHDYHYALKETLHSIAQKLVEGDSELDYKLTVDTAPILERDLAYRAGLGFFGDNAHLINQDYGSYFFIGSILLNKKLPLEVGTPIDRDCGHCTKCLRSCPTKAIGSDVDASKCVSTFSVETFKDTTPPQGYGAEGYIFGCDICSEVCPWNVRPLKGVEMEFELTERERHFANFLLLRPVGDILNELQQMSNKAYQRFFKGTSFERTGRVGLLKNFNYYCKARKEWTR